MRPVTQSRTGETGTCFRASLASILNLKEKQVPDFGEANEDPGIDTFLAKYGLRYQEVPIGNTAPVGYHIITGISPRGGMHAVVGQDGQIVWDPHPLDGTAHGLTTQEKYGLLLPAGAKDGLFTSRLDRYSMEQLLDTLGIDIKEFLRRSVVQRERLLDTAIKELDRKTGRAKDMSKFSGAEAARRAWITNKDPKQAEALKIAYHKAVKRGELERSLKPGARDSSDRRANTDKVNGWTIKQDSAGNYVCTKPGFVSMNVATLPQAERMCEEGGTKIWSLARDSDPRDGVTKCQACGVGLMGDDVLERGGKVICPECADAAVRRKAKDNGEFTWAEVKAEAARLRAQGKVVKILKHEFTNPRTGHVDTSYSCVVQPTLAKDTSYSEAQKKYVDGPNSDGEFSAGVSGLSGTAQRGGFKTRKEAEAWIAKMLPKVRRKPALDRARLHRALDAVMDSRGARDSAKIAYVKNRLYADKVSPDMDHNVGGEWLSPGKQLTSFDASDKGVFFKDMYGTIYHVDFSDCNRNLTAKKPR